MAGGDHQRTANSRRHLGKICIFSSNRVRPQCKLYMVAIIGIGTSEG